MSHDLFLRRQLRRLLVAARFGRAVGFGEDYHLVGLPAPLSMV